MKRTKITIKSNTYQVETVDEFAKNRFRDMAEDYGADGVNIVEDSLDDKMVVEFSRDQFSLGFDTPSGDFVAIE